MNTQPREPEVAIQMNQLEIVTDELEKNIISLKERIGPILRERPCGGNEVVKAVEDLCPLAAAIRRCQNKLLELNQSLREIIAACEL